jgi:hypothetical protein
MLAKELSKTGCKQFCGFGKQQSKVMPPRSSSLDVCTARAKEASSPIDKKPLATSQLRLNKATKTQRLILQTTPVQSAALRWPLLLLLLLLHLLLHHLLFFLLKALFVAVVVRTARSSNPALGAKQLCIVKKSASALTGKAGTRRTALRRTRSSDCDYRFDQKEECSMIGRDLSNSSYWFCRGPTGP